MSESVEIDEASQSAAKIAAESAAKLRRNIQKGDILAMVLIAAIMIGFVVIVVWGAKEEDEARRKRKKNEKEK